MFSGSFFYRFLFLCLFLLLFFLRLPEAMAVDDQREHPSRFGFSGIGYFYDTYGLSTLNLWRESGARWVRGTCSWHDVQYFNSDIINGNFRWEQNDALVQRYYQMGIKILPVLGFNLQVDEQKLSSPAKFCLTMPDLTPRIYEPFFGRKISYWENYVFRVVSRYGSSANGLGEGYGQNKIKYWEVWNEEDQNFWWDSCDGGRVKPDPKQYSQLLKATYDVIKKADPTAVVLLGGLSDWAPEAENNPLKLNQKTRNFLKGIYDEGAFAKFDILAIHPYRVIEQDANNLTVYWSDLVGFLRQLESSYDRPIWITEIGVNHNYFSEKEETRKIEQVYNQISSLPLSGKVFWYKLMPNSYEGEKEDIEYALTKCVEKDETGYCKRWTKRQSFEVYKGLAWQSFNVSGEGVFGEMDLTDRASGFYWENDKGVRLTFGELNNQGGGAWYPNGERELEDKNRYPPDRLFCAHPRWTNGTTEGESFVKATFDVNLPNSENIRLEGKLGFPSWRTLTNGVKVTIDVRDPSNFSLFPNLWKKLVLLDNELDSFSVDLTPFRDLKVPLIVTIFSNGHSYADELCWLDFKIVYKQSEIFPSPTPVPSLTLTPTAFQVTPTVVTPTPTLLPSATPFFSLTPTSGPEGCFCVYSSGWRRTRVFGDADCDGVINETDFGFWRQEFWGEKMEEGKSADFNCDGKVDGRDFEIWRSGRYRVYN